MKKIILSTLLLTIPTFALANPGPYAEVFGGQNTIHTNGSWTMDSNGWDQHDERETGYVGGFGVGYLMGNNTMNFGGELDTLIYPNSTSDHFKYSGRNISVLGVFKYKPFSQVGFTTFLKVGVAYVNQTFTYTNVRTWLNYGNPVSGQVTETDFAPEVDIGVGYQLTQNLEVDLIENQVFLSFGDNTGDGKEAAQNENTLLGVSYRFA